LEEESSFQCPAVTTPSSEPTCSLTQWGEWSNKTECQAGTKETTQRRARKCSKELKNGTVPCDPPDCNNEAFEEELTVRCPEGSTTSTPNEACLLSEWGNWFNISVCKPGIQEITRERNRTCSEEGNEESLVCSPEDCGSEELVEQALILCPEAGTTAAPKASCFLTEWGEWTNEGICETNVKEIVRTRNRTCYKEMNTIRVDCQPKECENDTLIDESTVLCPEVVSTTPAPETACLLSPWREWENTVECSPDKQEIVRTRKRSCYKELNTNRVDCLPKQCDNNTLVEESKVQCPEVSTSPAPEIACVLSPWGEWENTTQCSSDIQEVIQRRNRSCSNNVTNEACLHEQCDNEILKEEVRLKCLEASTVDPSLSCFLTPWGEWETIGICGSGVQSLNQKRNRTCSKEIGDETVPCGPDECNDELLVEESSVECPNVTSGAPSPACSLTSWGEWSAKEMCEPNKEEAINTRNRSCSKKVNNETVACKPDECNNEPLEEENVETCQQSTTEKDVSDCFVTEWFQWNPVFCGNWKNIKQRRIRTCSKRSKYYGSLSKCKEEECKTDITEWVQSRKFDCRG